jgi:hypothetical protein
VKHAFAIGISALVLGLPAAARAQAVSAGVRAGVNSATLKFDVDDDLVDPQRRTGFSGGIFVTVPANAVVALQPELLFSAQGVRVSQEGITATLAIDYVQVPVLGRFALGAGSPVAVLVGPSFGIRTRADANVPGAPTEFTEEFEDQVERFDVALVTGLAADVGRFVLDGRYTWGLRNIATDAGDGSVKNRVLTISAGVRF